MGTDPRFEAVTGMVHQPFASVGSQWARLLKRLFDIMASAAGIVIASPLLIVIAILIWLGSGRPIFFSQDRAGLGGKAFRIWKFRTMTQSRDSTGGLLSDAERTTALGLFLRRWSLDELPQLVNVLSGSMSIVGPRPLVTIYLPRYSPTQRRRHEVKPGITGLAQVSGRNALTWEEQFRYDVEYVDNWSLMLDLRILAATLLHVVTGRGAGPRADGPTGEFLGRNAATIDSPAEPK